MEPAPRLACLIHLATLSSWRTSGLPDRADQSRKEVQGGRTHLLGGSRSQREERGTHWRRTTFKLTHHSFQHRAVDVNSPSGQLRAKSPLLLQGRSEWRVSARTKSCFPCCRKFWGTDIRSKMQTIEAHVHTHHNFL